MFVLWPLFVVSSDTVLWSHYLIYYYVISQVEGFFPQNKFIKIAIVIIIVPLVVNVSSHACSLTCTLLYTEFYCLRY